MTRQEHLLICLMEECAEIQQATAKALRFGLDNGYPESGVTNREDISRECTDLISIIEMLETEKIITAFRLFESIKIKKEKVDKYIEYAESIGTIY